MADDSFYIPPPATLCVSHRISGESKYHGGAGGQDTHGGDSGRAVMLVVASACLFLRLRRLAQGDLTWLLLGIAVHLGLGGSVLN